MALKVGDLVFNVKANTAQLTTGLAGALGELKSFSVATTAIAGLAGLAAAGAGVGVWAVKLASGLEQATVQFTTMLGSAEKAKAMLEDLKNFAAKTPFEFTQLQDSARTLMAYGLTLEQIMPTIKALGDVSGGNAEKFSRLSLAFGQIATKGKLAGQELMQLREAGFDPMAQIIKRTGETADEFYKRQEAGKITLQEVALALQDVTSEGGKFHNGMEALSKTLEGQWSTFKDNLAELGRTIGKDIVPQLTAAVKELNEFLTMLEKIRNAKRDTPGGAFLGSLKDNSVAFLSGMADGMMRLATNGGSANTVLAGMEAALKGVFGIVEEKETIWKSLGEVFESIADQTAVPMKDIIDSLEDALKGVGKTLDDVDKAFEKNKKSGKDAFEDAMTPLEKYAAEVERLQKLLEGGFITDETFGRLINKLQGGLNRESGSLGTGAKSGSEAFSAIEEFRRREIVNKASEDMLRVSKESRDFLRDIHTELTKDKGEKITLVKGHI